MTLLLIRPVNFDYNPMTAVNNAFQKYSDAVDNQSKALKEFDGLVSCLNEHDIDTLIVEDTIDPHTPDSIFPNNWISFHKENTVVLYPMFAENRRLERKQSVLQSIKAKFLVDKIIDYSRYEKEGRYLEGTGSFVLDRMNGIAFACRSPRTDDELFKVFCAQLDYHPVLFNASDENGQEIYHTNVMMCVAEQYIVINMVCVEEQDRPILSEIFKKTGKAVIDISFQQMNHFAGNMLQVENRKNDKFLVMSTQAFDSLSHGQKATLTAFNPLIHSPLDTIESNGGGSCRCMLAEMDLEKRSTAPALPG
jgi:hypothetical protein